MSEKENVIFDLELQIEWIKEHRFPGWLNVTDTIQRAIDMMLRL